MAEEDQEKTTFITSQGQYCYKAVPFWFEERRSHVPKFGKPDVQQANWKECRSVRRRYARQEQRRREPLERSQGDIQHAQTVQHEAKSVQIFLWSLLKEIPLVHGVAKVDRGKS